MAKPTKHATLICVILSILAAIGIVAGLIKLSPLIIVLSLLPAVIYEVYRTEGKSTKLASIALLAVLAAEVILITLKINFNLAEFLGESRRMVAGYSVPLGDIKVVGPAIMAILSVILFVRTRGRYTKWLAIIIFITSFAIIYTINPESFKEFLRIGVKEVLDQVQY